MSSTVKARALRGVGILTRMGGVERAEHEQRVPSAELQLPKGEAGEPAGVRCTAGATARLRRQGEGRTARIRREATSGEERTALIWRQAGPASERPRGVVAPDQAGRGGGAGRPRRSKEEDGAVDRGWRAEGEGAQRSGAGSRRRGRRWTGAADGGCVRRPS